MNCDVAHDLLQQCLDGMPIESSEWLAHLRQCGDCQAMAVAGRRLQEGLNRLIVPLPPPGLAERIAERVLLDRRRARRQVRRRWAVSLALAASLILALAVRLDWNGTPTGSDIRSTEEASLSSPMNQGTKGEAEDKAASTLRESAAELGEAFTALRNQTADETLDQTRRWVSNVPSPAMPKVDLATMGSPTRPLREAGEGVSQGLEPVTNSARRAVDLFLRELPTETMETN